ncbi:2-keto-3-deoxy-phosphogalactonate aldolase [Palleronia aestuarii]|uniref:2-keto-3-deoxy-phosphogalactonate aldolase n=1 Tax=Palleronia aestuarii TaxID=568105 RepID=A0A2W7MQB0_9RHOB|nr:2-dehydro-3-deoxy-6-phosphogalactonate aldolase [Palleronia aestuarii]PZX10130.1 2-keto-3-deoxy-phosphogalactonate aldolase [Palleronia aestuarii]
MTRELIAILRGIDPEEADAISDVLVEAGITRIEVPLNSPKPLVSIRRMAERHAGRTEIGAGTVLQPAQVEEVRAAGGMLIVSPNFNPAVVTATRDAEMKSYPGVLTPSECFAALAAGATGLKVFPAFQMGVEGLKAIRAVLPVETAIYMVGGVGPSNFAEWRAAGATGFGIGTALYRPGDDARDVGVRAREMVSAWEETCR